MDDLRKIAKRTQASAARMVQTHKILYSEALPMAIRAAAEETGAECNDIENALIEWHIELGEMGKKNSRERAAQRALTGSNSNGHDTESAKDEDEPQTFRSLYNTWIEKHDVIPSDETLAHFTQTTKGAAIGARRDLREAGYEIVSIDNNGWKVVKRPVKRTTEVVQLELTEAITNNLQNKAVSLVIELMQMLHGGK